MTSHAQYLQVVLHIVEVVSVFVVDIMSLIGALFVAPNADVYIKTKLYGNLIHASISGTSRLSIKEVGILSTTLVPSLLATNLNSMLS
jgi:hypothetical protein